jgi:hypothetical protein
MSKVGEYFREVEELNGPVDDPTGPTDAELAEIENTLDTVSWEDIEWN